MRPPLQHTALPPAGEGDEWAVGMPAYWLRQVVAGPGEAPLLARFYYVKPAAPDPAHAYDQRLPVRVGGSERALRAAVDFAWRYFASMGHRFTARSLKTLNERMVRGWELAGRPGA